MTHSRPVIRDLLTERGLAPRRDLGQNFVADPNTVRRIAHLARVGAGDHVVEIGAGLGSLTLALAETAATIPADEVDVGLVAVLRDVFAGHRTVTVLEADAMNADWTALLGERAVGSVLVANLPYNVATPLVVESLDGLPSLELWTVMVQREVADRFFARPGTKAYGAVSVLVQLATERTGFHPVSRTVFQPPPNVDSALIAFRRRELPAHYAHVKRVVEAGFSHRRKTLPNSVELSGLAERERAAVALGAIGRPPGTRAEALEPEEFAALAEALR